MKPKLPGNLDEIFPLRFRLREQLHFFRHGDAIVAESPAKGKRYSLRPWQHEMISRFDGCTNFEAAAKEVYAARPGAFTATGLLNFYNWLYDEDLVVCECESIFELVSEGAPDGANELGVSRRYRLSEFAERLLRDSRMRRALVVSAVAVFSLSVIRIAWVAAPIFEPPVNRLYAEVSELLEDRRPAISLAESHRAAETTEVAEIEFASRALPPDGEAPGTSLSAKTQSIELPDAQPEPPSVSADPTIDLAPAKGSIADLGRIDALRVDLEECRIRRDEFYLQNDEEGYRREVHRMTNLAKEIGDIENSLR